MAVPVISAEKKEISYNERANCSVKEILMNFFNGLSHSIWHCKFHVVWIQKYRRKELYITPIGARHRFFDIKIW